MKNFLKKKYTTIIVIMFATILLFFFKSQIVLFIWNLSLENPVTWNNVRVHRDNNMIYKMDEGKIVFIYWDKVPDGTMSISKLTIDNPSKIIDVLIKQDYLILSSQFKVLNGHESIFIKHKKRNQNDLDQTIYVIPFNILINFSGPEESYPSFQNVINKLEFLAPVNDRSNRAINGSN
jgi:hypothetical protein